MAAKRGLAAGALLFAIAALPSVAAQGPSVSITWDGDHLIDEQGRGELDATVRVTADLLGCAPETVRLAFGPFPKWAGAAFDPPAVRFPPMSPGQTEEANSSAVFAWAVSSMPPDRDSAAYSVKVDFGFPTRTSVCIMSPATVQGQTAFDMRCGESNCGRDAASQREPPDRTGSGRVPASALSLVVAAIALAALIRIGFSPRTSR